MADMLDGGDREWFLKEKERLEEQIREEMQEAISNVHILNQNMEHLNDVGHEIVSISAVWVDFLRQMASSAEKRR
uniref:Uncharacterized protein n=1 Tax=Globisporangium ultimum (strain ATCC 200006 / CBS 805.95 / DAOM BR144) TaxID=431595 RepID=K3WH92_GLOUD